MSSVEDQINRVNGKSKHSSLSIGFIHLPMSYMIGTANPTNGASTFINVDGMTTQYFKNLGATASTPTNVTITYTVSNVTATSYLATVVIRNNNMTTWTAPSWTMTWGLDYGETIKSQTGCSATLTGRTVQLTSTSAASIAGLGTLSVTVTMKTTASQHSMGVIIGFNGVIYRTASSTYLATVLAQLPEGHNNTGTVTVGDVIVNSPADSSLAYVTFLGKSANMKNVLGYFTFPTGSPPTSPTQVTLMILIPYMEYVIGGGSLAAWNTFALPYSFSYSGGVATPTSYLWPANTSIGFFIGQDGWTVTGGVGTLNTTCPHWYSISALNNGGEKHWATTSAAMETPNTTTICYEDTPLVLSDHDYNDGVFQIRFY